MQFAWIKEDSLGEQLDVGMHENVGGEFWLTKIGGGSILETQPKT